MYRVYFNHPFGYATTIYYTVICLTWEREVHKVSVIIPVYNGARHIPNTFRFLSEQTFKDYEVIFIVDVKTTDGTLDAIRENTPERWDVKVLNQDGDGKLGEARNIGLEQASGDVIWFFDVDDRPLPEFLSTLLNIMDTHNADTVMCNFVRSDDLNIRPREREERKVWVMNSREAMQARLNEKIPVTAWSRITTKKLLIDNGIRFNHEFSEDIEHTFSILNASDVICYCHEPLYIYFQNPESICGDRGHDNIRGRAEIDAYARLEGLLEGTGTKRFRRKAALTSIRSAVHMDRRSFVEFAKSSEFRELMKRNLSDPPSFEAYVVRAVPSLYHACVKAFLDIIYYRNGKSFS